MVGGRMEPGEEAQMLKNPTCYSVDVCGKKILAILVGGPSLQINYLVQSSDVLVRRKIGLGSLWTVALCVSSGR